MSSYSFSRETINVNPQVSAVSGGTTTAGGSIFIKVFSQNLAGNNKGSNPTSVSYTTGQQIQVTVPATMRNTGEFVERFVIAGSATGASGSWVQLAIIEAVDSNGVPLALPLSVNLSSDYDLSLNKSSPNAAGLPQTAKLGALTSIISLGGAIYRFETNWPVAADGVDVIAVTGGVWVRHYATLNPEPGNVYGFQGDRQNNQGVTTPTKLIAYNGTGTYSRSFYYSLYNDAASGGTLQAGTNIALQVLADGRSVTADLNQKVELTLVGYVDSNGILYTAPATGLPSLLYDYSDKGQLYLPDPLPSGYQAVYRLRLIYSLADFAQIGATRSLTLNLSTYAQAPTTAPWGSLVGDYISQDGGQFKVFPGLGLAIQVDDGQASFNKLQTPVTSEQTVVGYAANTAGQLAVINATGQVLYQPSSYTLSASERLLATIGTVPGEHRVLNLGSATLSAAGGIAVTINHPVNAQGRATIRSNYSDTRIAGVSNGFARFNVDNIRIYLTNGANTYLTTVTALNQSSQVVNINALGSSVATPTVNNFGLYTPVSVSSANITGTIPAGTYNISIGYEYDQNSITSIAHNPAFTIFNANAAQLVGQHETTFNHANFVTASQAQGYVAAHETTFNHGNFLTTANAASTYLTQANAATLYKPLTTDDSVATGLRFALKTSITGTPSTGEVQFNNTTLASVTQLLISESGRDGSAIPTLLDMLQATTRIIIQSEQLEGAYAWFNITGPPVDSGTYRTVPVAFVTAPTGITNVSNLGVATSELTVNFYGAGGGGGSGVGSGLEFQYTTASSTADGDGQFARNGTSFANATQLSFSVFENQIGFPSTSDVLLRLTNGSIFEVRKSATAYSRYRSTGTPVLDTINNGDFYNIPVVYLATGPDPINDTDTIYLSVVNDSPGQSGANGTNGVTSGQSYKLTTAASTASGQVRFAGGILYIHESDRTPVNLTTLWQNLAPGSNIQIIDEVTPTNYANYTLGTWVGNPPKNGSVYELPATNAGSNGTISDTTNVRVSFSIKGAPGNTGATGPSPVTSVNSASNPVTPAINASATYTVLDTTGLIVNQYYGFSGVAGTFLATSKTATTVTFQNIDGDVGTTILQNTLISPVGRRGVQGLTGAPGGTGNPRGTWSSATTDYIKGDIVTYLGSSYFVILPTGSVPANTPPPNATYYQTIAQKGDAGPANSLSIGTVTTGSASATITGTAPSQTLNLVIPQGPQGFSTFTTTTGANPNTPAINATATYSVVASDMFLVNSSYVSFAGVTGQFLVTAIPSSTSITVQNIDATVGATIPASIKVAVVGQRGPQGATGGLTSRQSIVVDSGSIAAGATFDGLVATAKAADIITISSNSVSCRVRLYKSIAAKNADAARLTGAVPASQAGVIEVGLSSANNYSIDVAGETSVRLFSREATPTVNTPILITNREATAANPQVTIVFTPQEI